MFRLNILILGRVSVKIGGRLRPINASFSAFVCWSGSVGFDIPIRRRLLVLSLMLVNFLDLCVILILPVTIPTFLRSLETIQILRRLLVITLECWECVVGRLTAVCKNLLLNSELVWRALSTKSRESSHLVLVLILFLLLFVVICGSQVIRTVIPQKIAPIIHPNFRIQIPISRPTRLLSRLRRSLKSPSIIDLTKVFLILIRIHFPMCLTKHSLLIVGSPWCCSVYIWWCELVPFFKIQLGPILLSVRAQRGLFRVAGAHWFTPVGVTSSSWWGLVCAYCGCQVSK